MYTMDQFHIFGFATREAYKDCGCLERLRIEDLELDMSASDKR
jgi:hypothetical protein